MGFMQPEVYKGEYYELDTTEGTQYIPVDVVGLVDSVDQLRDYYAGRLMDPDNVSLEPQSGWLYRLQAPGYMDCTEWSVADTEKEAYESLKELYGDDDNDE